MQCANEREAWKTAELSFFPQPGLAQPFEDQGHHWRRHPRKSDHAFDGEIRIQATGFRQGGLRFFYLAFERKSSGSQFYICLQPQPGLDGQYTIFGGVVKGMSVVDQIKVGDHMKKITLSSKPTA